MCQHKSNYNTGRNSTKLATQETTTFLITQSVIINAKLATKDIFPNINRMTFLVPDDLDLQSRTSKGPNTSSV